MSNHLELCNHRLILLLEAMSPITHMAGSAGNESLVAREIVRTPDGAMVGVPHLSGNALRHVAVREPGMHDLVDRYGLTGTLTPDQQQFLYNGGANTSSGRADDYKLVGDLQRHWPLLRVLGGTLPQQVFRGSLFGGRGMLVCRENRARIQQILPEWVEGIDLGQLRPAEMFLSTYQYTRSAATDTDETAYGGPYQMIFGGQQVVAGSCFLVEMILRSVTLVEVGGLLHSIRLWQAAGGIVGGMSAKGHGRMAITLGGLDPGMQCEAVTRYVEQTQNGAAAAIEVLQRAFAKAEARPTKAAKKAAGKKGKKVEEQEAAPEQEGEPGE